MKHISHAKFLTHFQKPVHRWVIQTNVQDRRSPYCSRLRPPTFGSESIGIPKAFRTPALPGRPGTPSYPCISTAAPADSGDDGGRNKRMERVLFAGIDWAHPRGPILETPEAAAHTVVQPP